LQSPYSGQAGRAAPTLLSDGTTSTYLQGIDPKEIITDGRTRGRPLMSAGAGLKLLTERRPPRAGAPIRCSRSSSPAK
jgi:hypothetical protein